MTLENTPARPALAKAGLLFLTTSEAAALLRLAPRTLERFRLEGSGPRFRKLGRRVVYAEGDLAAWADARARQSTGEAA